jgi:hypothetical protein
MLAVVALMAATVSATGGNSFIAAVTAVRYPLYSNVLLSVDFRSDSILFDPASVAIVLYSPDGDVLSFTPSHDSVGSYSYVAYGSQAGTWRYVWEADGVKQEGSFAILPSALV